MGAGNRPLLVMRDTQYYTYETVDGIIRSYANVPNVPSQPGVRCHICNECRLSFSESKMVQYKGKWYGIPCDCYRDIKTLREREMNLKIRSRAREERS